MEQENLAHKGEAPKVKSLAKALNVLSCFTTQHPVWGISDLAERIGVTKSNIHNIVSTFCGMGYLDRTPDGHYTLGLKMLEFAFIINQNLGYPNAVYDIMVETAGQTDEIVYFGLPYGERVLYLYVAHPTNRIGVLPYRDILRPLPCTAPAWARPCCPPCRRRSGPHTCRSSGFHTSPTPSQIWMLFLKSCTGRNGWAMPSTTVSTMPMSGVSAYRYTVPGEIWSPD